MIVNYQDVETKAIPASQIKSLSDPRRRIRIRPRVMRQVRRFVRNHLWPDAIENPLSLGARVKRVANYIADQPTLESCVLNLDA